MQGQIEYLRFGVSWRNKGFPLAGYMGVCFDYSIPKRLKVTYSTTRTRRPSYRRRGIGDNTGNLISWSLSPCNRVLKKGCYEDSVDRI